MKTLASLKNLNYHVRVLKKAFKFVVSTMSLTITYLAELKKSV